MCLTANRDGQKTPYTHRESSPARDGSGFAPDYPVRADEISLFDLWLVLVRRRWLLIGIFTAVLIAGTAWTLTRADVYEYSAVLGVGKVFEPNDEGLQLVPVQPPRSVVAEIRSVHRSAAVRQVVGDPSDADYRPNVKAESPEGSDLVIVSGQATRGNADALNQTIEVIADHVKKRHEARIASARQSLEGKIQSATSELARLEARQEAGQTRLADLDARVASLEDRRRSLEDELEQLISQRQSLSDPASSRELISLNARIGDVRDKLNRANDKLMEEIPAERREARLELNELSSDIEASRAAVERARARLEQIEPTQLRSEPQRSLEPTGTSDRLILALAIVLGALLAVFSAFVWEFITRANAYVREQEGEPVE